VANFNGDGDLSFAADGAGMRHLYFSL
jgi:hypothetical protein